MVAEREREIERTRKVLSLKVCASPWWYWWPFRWRSYDLERSWRQSVFVGDWRKPIWLLINDILYETASLRTVNSGHHRSYIKTQGVRSWHFDFFFQLVIFLSGGQNAKFDCCCLIIFNIFSKMSPRIGDMYRWRNSHSITSIVYCIHHDELSSLSRSATSSSSSE